MSEHGLRIVSDPRWVVALPGQDVACEVAHQLGDSPLSGTAEGLDVLDAAGGVLQGAIDSGAWWAAALVLEEAGEAVVVRSTIEWSGPADEPITANDIFDVLVNDNRDADYAARLDLVSTQLGAAVRHQQVLLYGDGTLGDYIGFSIPYANGVLAIQTFSTATGWVEFFGPMVEAMVLSLSPDAQREFGEITLLSYVAAGDEL